MKTLLLALLITASVFSGEVHCIKIDNTLTICTDENGNDTEIWSDNIEEHGVKPITFPSFHDELDPYDEK